MAIESDRERQAPRSLAKAEPSHLARYRFAANYVRRSARVLDVPSGTGYGCYLLADKPDVEVVGVEIHQPAVEHARELFSRGNTTYLCGNIEAMGDLFEHSGAFDLITSFEGIEHLHDQAAFVAEAARLLRPDGLFIVGTPRKPHGSPFHTREYSLAEFTQELSAHFAVGRMYGQIFTDIFDMELRREDPAAYRRFNFIAICRPKPSRPPVSG